MREQIRAAANAMKGLTALSLKGEIVVLGSTYMAQFPLYELVNRCQLESAVYNRSIAGLTISEAAELWPDCILPIRPGKLFLSLGEADEGNPDAAGQYAALVQKIRTELPACRLYLIELPGESVHAQEINACIRALCDRKHISRIRFVSPALSEAALYKARFKQISRFFRDQPPTMSEAFALANL